MLGERVLIARQASELTQKGLSDVTGISSSKISKIETGMLAPTEAEIRAISEALSVPASFFVDAPVYPTAEGRFRKQSKAPKAKLKYLTSVTTMLAEVIQQASVDYRLRSVTIRPLEGEASEEGVEEQAGMARAALGVPSRGPLGNVTRACERGGVAVAKIPLPSEGRDLSGYSVWGGMGEMRPLIVVSASLPGDVLRATVAHELGHLVLHTRRPLVSPGDAEQEAWGFANHLIFPKEDATRIFESTPVTLGSLLRVKRNYGASVSFLISCCRRYGIIDEARERSLRKQCSARGWYANEPVEVVPETTTMVPTVLSRMRGDGKDIGLQELLAWRLSTTA